MNKETLWRMNRMFGDAFGYAPMFDAKGDSQPRYKWCWSPDLVFPYKVGENWVKTAGGLYVDEPVYWDMPQLDDERWVVGLWRDPPDPGEWLRQFGKSIKFPQRGIYYVTKHMCKVGAEPDEEVTSYVIEGLKQSKAMSDAEVLAAIDKMGEDQSREIANQEEAILNDALPAHGFWHVQGLRGGDVSYGGIETGETA